MKLKIKTIIATGEGYTVEFKEAFSDNIGKTICAFANGAGGRIILGVKDNGQVIGFRLTNKLKSQIIDIGRNIDPTIQLKVNEESKITIIEVPEGKEKPYSNCGQYYLRIGANSQKMRREELRKFFQNEGLIRFDEKINSSFKLSEDLNQIVLIQFLQKAKISNILPIKQILQNLSIFDGKHLKNAGVLFFCKTTTNFFVSAKITCVLYKGNNKIEILDKKEFEEDLYSNYHNAFTYICSKLNTNYILTGREREEKLEIPERAIAESLINAIAHRDYFSNGHIQVDIYLNRIEIANPGGLISGITKKEFGKKSVPRNPLLFGLMAKIRLGEMAGTGIERIKKAMKEYNLKCEFDISENWFTIILHKPISLILNKDLDKDLDKDLELNNNQKQIIIEIQKNKNITQKELSEIINITEKNIRNNIKKLKSKAIIERVGPDNGGYWIIKKGEMNNNENKRNVS